MSEQPARKKRRCKHGGRRKNAGRKWNNHKQGVSNHQTLNFSGTSRTSTPSIFIPNLADHRLKLIGNGSEAILMQHLRFFTKRNREQY